MSDTSPLIIDLDLYINPRQVEGDEKSLSYNMDISNELFEGGSLTFRALHAAMVPCLCRGEFSDNMYTYMLSRTYSITYMYTYWFPHAMDNNLALIYLSIYLSIHSRLRNITFVVTKVHVILSINMNA